MDDSDNEPDHYLEKMKLEGEMRDSEDGSYFIIYPFHSFDYYKNRVYFVKYVFLLSLASS